MFSKHNKFIVSVILLLGFLHGTQAKKCYSCEGINCLRTSKVKETETCIDPMDDCVTIFEGLTVIARGCISKLPEDQRNKCNSLSNPECHKCYKDLCNDRGAIECVHCNSNDNKDCSTSSANIASSRCGVSTSSNSYCYTRSSSGIVQRGCLLDEEEQLKCLHEASCEMCLPGYGEACNREANKVISSAANQIKTFTMFIVLSLFISTLFLR